MRVYLHTYNRELARAGALYSTVTDSVSAYANRGPFGTHLVPVAPTYILSSSLGSSRSAVKNVILKRTRAQGPTRFIRIFYL